MKRHVFKFDAGGEFHALPVGATIVHFGQDGNKALCIWVDADFTPNGPVTWRRFIIVGTGWNIDPGDHHIATTVTHDGFVWHLFERGLA